jgi:TatA/E family protein of Tat protein translocase
MDGMLADIGIGEIALIALIIFALFGYKKLPDAARSLGRSMRVFKAETRGLSEDDVRGKAEARAAHGPLGEPATGDTTQPDTTQPAHGEPVHSEPVHSEPTHAEATTASAAPAGEKPVQQQAAGA